MLGGDDDFGKNFFSDVLRHVASMTMPTVGQATEDILYTTSRDAFHGTREDVSTESGITVSDETSLLVEARPSPVDLGKQKEIVGVLVKFLQVRHQRHGSFVHLDPIVKISAPTNLILQIILILRPNENKKAKKVKTSALKVLL